MINRGPRFGYLVAGTLALVACTPTGVETSDLPGPTGRVQLLANEVEGYRLRYPAEYNVVLYGRSICFTLSDAPTMACHVASAFVDVSDADGRTLGEVADAIAADSTPDIEVERTNLNVAGEDAILLDNIYTYDVLRKLVILHNDRVYTVTFVPWQETNEAFEHLETLYTTLIDSFEFLK